MNRKILALLLAGTFVFAGCDIEKNQEEMVKKESQKAEKEIQEMKKEDDKKAEEKVEDTQTAEKTDVEVVLPDTKVTLKAASYKFESHVGGEPYNLTEVKFETEAGKAVYEFEGNKNGEEYSLAVDANSAETVESESEKADDKKEPVDLGKAIPPEEAMRIAIEENGGGKVKEWTLYNDGDGEKYEIELEDGKEITVNAINKKVM